MKNCGIVWIFLLVVVFFSSVVHADDITFHSNGKEHRLIELPNQFIAGVKGDVQRIQSFVKEVQSNKESALSQEQVAIRSFGKDMVLITTSTLSLKSKKAKILTELKSSKNLDFVYPVYRWFHSKLRVYPYPEVTVCITEGASIEDIAQRYDLTVVRPLLFTSDQFVLRLDGKRNPFEISDRLCEAPDVLWANPNYIRQLDKRFTPNDPMYSDQWHLNNTGQGGGKAGADVRAETAWDLQMPSSDVVIAVVDDAVDTDHPDLNIYTNQTEANGQTGVDDDQNGLIDDIHGWDFGNNDNDPRSNTEEDAHGTAVAGVAAAKGNNNVGVVGASFGSLVLPVRISFEGEDEAAMDASIADAIRYAAKYADVMNNSWGGPVLSDTISSALDFATSSQGKRGEKGVPVLFASGNDATWFLSYESDETIAAGNHTIKMVYEKDASGTSGDDNVFISDAVLVDAEEGVEIDDQWILPYDDLFPEGVTTSGDKGFTIVESNLAESGYVYQSGAIGDNQRSELIWTVNVPQEAILAVQFRMSTEKNKDVLKIYVDDQEFDGSVYLSDENILLSPFSGETPENIMPLAGENTHPNVINIGASTDGDVRATYSQWGTQLDFLAPSNGGAADITTTDVSQSGYGYDPDSAYDNTFGGTSSACPLATGVFAVVLAADPSLTVEELMNVFKQTSAKIGELEYDANGWNEQYGYGRLDMAAALQYLAQNDSPTAVPTSASTSTPTATPVPPPVSTPTPSPTPTATNTPVSMQTHTPTPAPVSENMVFIFDDINHTSVDLTGQTDFDPLDDRNITIAWSNMSPDATDWHIYVQRGFGGMKYLGRTASGTASSFDWKAGANNLAAEFANGPDFNSAYTFRVIRIDGKLDADDYFDMTAPVGFNVEGGNDVPLAQPAMPVLDENTVAVCDDLLGLNNLAPMGSTGSDTDDIRWNALQIAWNFGVDTSEINEYHVFVSVNNGDPQFLGQTYTGNINYFWWTPQKYFQTEDTFLEGPQDGNTYQFTVIMKPMSGTNQNMTSGTITYTISQ